MSSSSFFGYSDDSLSYAQRFLSCNAFGDKERKDYI